jgi:Rod binding domain-containing protein
MSDTVLSLGSTPLLSSGPLTSASQSGGSKDSPEKIHHAAQQFESLLISQILKTAHSEDEGWLGTGDDPTASSAMGIAEEQFAQAISARGGLGLSGLIEQGLTKSTNATHH